MYTGSRVTCTTMDQGSERSDILLFRKGGAANRKQGLRDYRVSGTLFAPSGNNSLIQRAAPAPHPPTLLYTVASAIPFTDGGPQRARFHSSWHRG